MNHQAAQELVILPAPGEVLLFSGAQLHTSIPNTSGRARYSVDFRTVDVGDLLAGRGAPLVDVVLHRHGDPRLPQRRRRERFDEETVIELFGAPPPDAMLVFSAPAAERSAQSV